MLLTRNIAIAAVVVSGVVGLAAGGVTAWMVKGWKDSGELQKLTGKVETQQQSIATLEGANGRCTAAVGDVKGAVKQIVDDGVERSRRAQDAMAKAAKDAARNAKAAQDALNRPPPKAGDECPAMIREALDYAKRRKAGQ